MRLLRHLLRRKEADQELEEELRFHLESQIEVNLAKGMEPDDARTSALRSFGGVEQIKEICREERGGLLIDSVVKDVRHGLRSLRGSPGFTAVAVLTLTLGIGASTAVFSVVNGVLLRPLRYPDPEEIVTLWNSYPQLSDEKEEVSPPDFYDWWEQNRLFVHLAAYERHFFILAGDPAPVRLRGARVSGGFFSVMGVEPILGRPILPADDHEGAHHVVVLSHRLWTSRFGADRFLVGKTITLTGVAYSVLGVMPAGFRFPYDAELWSPLAYEPPFEPSLRRSVWLRTVGRLAPGVTMAQAQADVSRIAQRLEQLYPDTNEGRGVVAVSLHEQTVGDVRTALLVLSGAVGFLFLIACANLVNLLLARANGRRHEIALRAALGAGRPRLVRQLVTESTLLSLLGGAAGLLVASLSLSLLRRFSLQIPRLQEVQLDLRMLGFGIVVSLVAGVASGIVPALTATPKGIHESLKQTGSRSGDGVGRGRLRTALIVIEVALAQVLLIGGGLLFQSFLNMSSVRPGFKPEGLMVGGLELFSERYSTRRALRDFYRESVERVAALPGVQVAALGSTVPLNEGQLNLEFLIEGHPRPPLPTQYPWASYDSITPDYFRALGIRLVSGRFFTDADREDAPAVGIVNQAMARRYWPAEGALGRRIRIHDESPTDSEPIEIVGVVEDVRQMSLSAAALPQFYLPYGQRPWRQCFLFVRSETAPRGLAASVRRELRGIDRDLAVSELRAMGDYVSVSLDSPRFHAALLVVFAALALALAAVGVFGVVSYSTSQRTRELAVRVALGAQRSDVLRLVVGTGFLPVLVGVGLGLALALALTRTLSTLLFGIVPTDPFTYVAVGLLLGAVALFACYLPSRRATNVDPVVALRSE